MRWHYRLRAVLAGLFRRRTFDDQLQRDIAFHLDQEAADRMRCGLPPAEARRRAHLSFGSVEAVREDIRARRRLPIGEQLARDVHHAARGLRRTPGFTAIALLTLALGIGSTTAIVGVVYGVLLKPLPFPAPGRLVALYHFAPGIHPDDKAPQTSASYFTYREHGRVFEDIGLASWEDQNVSVVRNGEPEQIQALEITDGLLSVLGVRPVRGRFFQKQDDVPGAPNRVVVSYRYWQDALAGAADAVGRSLVIGAPDPAPYEVVGVLPASFRFRDSDAQIFLPLKLDRARANPGGFQFRGIARLKPGTTVADASADIARMLPLIIEQFPLPPAVTKQMWDDVGLAPHVMTLDDDVIGQMNRPLWILLGAVAFVLVMAWTNVVNLLLVRAEGRHRERAVRMALGASRARIAGGLLAESFLLGLAGGGLGVLFATGCLGVLRRLAPSALPRVDEIGINAPVVLVTLFISVVSSLVLGLIPLVRSRALKADVLREGGRSATDAPGRHRTLNVLVVAQVALALVLLVVSGLMVRTFTAMRQVQPGYLRPAEVQTFGVALPGSLIPDRRQVAPTYEEIAQRLAHVPGVVSVGLTRDLMMTGSTPAVPVDVQEWPASGLPPSRKRRAIGPGYFETMGNPLIAGRALTWADVHQGARVAMVTENLAREFWDEAADALGKHIGRAAGDGWSEIVGVVGNERDDGLNQPPPTVVFAPMALPIRDMTYLVRSTRVGAPGFLRELQQAVWTVNRNVPLTRVRTLQDVQARSMSQTSFAMVMLAMAAGAALMLALIGIYGVVSYIVAERTHEVGIRIALGAQASDVRGLFLRRGAVLTSVGLLVGCGGATLVTPAMSAMLFGVRPMDPATYAGVAILLGAVTLLATYLPARRASRVEPIRALRANA